MEKEARLAEHSSGDPRARVIVASAERPLLKMIVRFLATSPDVVVVGTAVTMAELLAGDEALEPQVALVDPSVFETAHEASLATLRSRMKATIVGLVEGSHHQGGEGELQAERSVTLEDVAVERVEGVEVLIVVADGAELRELPTLGRAWIDIGEMLEIGGILEIAEPGHAVPRDFRLDLRLPQSRPHDQHGRSAGAQRQRIAARHLARRALHDRALVLAALSASHHQIVGKTPWEPNFGISSGRPKRSQRAVRSLV